jgi:hypothetical protein
MYGLLIARIRSMKGGPSSADRSDELLIPQDLHRRTGHGTRERIASKRRAVIAGMEHTHDFLRAEHGGDGHDTAAEGLAEDPHVGLHAFEVRREELARDGPKPAWISSSMNRTLCFLQISSTRLR